MVGGLSATVRERRRENDKEADAHMYTWTGVPIQTQVIPLEERDAEFTRIVAIWK